MNLCQEMTIPESDEIVAQDFDLIDCVTFYNKINNRHRCGQLIGD